MPSFFLKPVGHLLLLSASFSVSALSSASFPFFFHSLLRSSFPSVVGFCLVPLLLPSECARGAAGGRRCRVVVGTVGWDVVFGTVVGWDWRLPLVVSGTATQESDGQGQK